MGNELQRRRTFELGKDDMIRGCFLGLALSLLLGWFLGRTVKPTSRPAGVVIGNVVGVTEVKPEHGGGWLLRVVPESANEEKK